MVKDEDDDCFRYCDHCQVPLPVLLPLYKIISSV